METKQGRQTHDNVRVRARWGREHGGRCPGRVPGWELLIEPEAGLGLRDGQERALQGGALEAQLLLPSHTFTHLPNGGSSAL